MATQAHDDLAEQRGKLRQEPAGIGNLRQRSPNGITPEFDTPHEQMMATMLARIAQFERDASK